MARKYFIAGNWKMNKVSPDCCELAKAVADKVGNETKVDVAICPTFTSLGCSGKQLSGSSVALGCQNIYPEDKGAFTGEISAPMVKALGVSYVILGHSERREYFKECDCFINKKVKATLAAGLKPILCVGETLGQRETNKTFDLIKGQLVEGLKDISKEDVKNIVIAYEPVWAIGTGKTATPEMAQEVHAFIRKVLGEIFCENCASTIQILYGGSMKGENAAGLLAMEDIDGGLIGGAALDADSFYAIIDAALKA